MKIDGNRPDQLGAANQAEAAERAQQNRTTIGPAGLAATARSRRPVARCPPAQLGRGGREGRARHPARRRRARQTETRGGRAGQRPPAPGRSHDRQPAVTVTARRRCPDGRPQGVARDCCRFRAGCRTSTVCATRSTPGRRRSSPPDPTTCSPSRRLAAAVDQPAVDLPARFSPPTVGSSGHVAQAQAALIRCRRLGASLGQLVERRSWRTGSPAGTTAAASRPPSRARRRARTRGADVSARHALGGGARARRAAVRPRRRRAEHRQRQHPGIHQAGRRTGRRAVARPVQRRRRRRDRRAPLCATVHRTPCEGRVASRAARGRHQPQLSVVEVASARPGARSTRTSTTSSTASPGWPRRRRRPRPARRSCSRGRRSAAFATCRPASRRAQRDTDTRVRASVEQINDLATRIASLNASLSGVPAAAPKALHLRDEVNLAVEELTRLRRGQGHRAARRGVGPRRWPAESRSSSVRTPTPVGVDRSGQGFARIVAVGGDDITRRSAPARSAAACTCATGRCPYHGGARRARLRPWRRGQRPARVGLRSERRSRRPFFQSVARGGLPASRGPRA
jgi:hypothetical protein